ncbi:uncharacterized protein FOMMEDRAFT_19911 [Fomitiporia mediterranea MF3/22]|uniref:uncharacterized protein n=1 Tax=Fomitiporia mediterranea (strain MF3/22) TaxID=694068 RepID=UPI0004409010|nr:uncharacterized protein FOMMEDRAFT_19911 [Fomitiporia mediterranea MF3/22]EJD02615.1 hypothetical protein FOMMEDRAFT_19911 [Fomitiporia mediterranea MF3/22]
MEAKLKALKVVELKELLNEAKVPIPAKANKPDLIAKIIDTEAASSLFQVKYGDASGRPSGASTPVPVAGAARTVVEKGTTEAQRVAEPAKESNILAPPEPFDWSAGAEPSAETTAKSTSVSAPSVTAKPSSSNAAASAAASTANPQSQAAPSQSPADEDEETKKRQARAERFGLPLIEKPVAPKAKKSAKAAANKPTIAATIGSGAKKAAVNSTDVVEEDPEKLKTRAMRFGLVDKVTPNKSAASSNGKKRTAPVEQVDAEEAERRRKRAERFGLPVKA